MKNNIRSNFDMLHAYEEPLWRLGALAERYFAEDPNTSLFRLRQLSELLAQSLAARTGPYTNPEESQYELIRRLQGEGGLPKEVKQVLDPIRAKTKSSVASKPCSLWPTASRPAAPPPARAQRPSPLVLAEAFRGELVPQDPNDEPASELLARIASLNTAVAGKNKRKVPVARKERAQKAISL